MTGTRLKFSVLSEKQKQEVHYAALDVLERTGIEIQDETSVSLLHSAGAEVYNKSLIKIPTWLVQESLLSAPSRITIYDRNGKPFLRLCDDNYYFMASPGCLNIIDHRTQEQRVVTYADLCDYSRLIDSLDQIEMVGSLMISDRPEILADRYQAEAIMLNSSKPFYLAPLSIEGLQDVIEMCTIVSGGHKELSKMPFFVTAANPIPPLMIPKLSCQKLLLMAENRLPVIFNPILIVGGSGPIDLLGNLVLLIANNLAELVLSQQKSKGTPVILGGLGAAMDMKTGQMPYGGPEFNLLCGALAEMGHYYKLPVWGTGGCSSSKSVDTQAMIEATSSIIFSSLTGAHLIHDVGFLDNGLTTSFEMLVLCDEVISMTRRTLQGIGVCNVSENLELIDQVGHKGNYLTRDETFQRFRELWTPNLFDRQSYTAWAASGKQGAGNNAKRKASAILEEHTPEKIDQQKAAEINQIIEKAIMKRQVS